MIKRRTLGDKIFDFFNIVLMLILTLAFLYPMWHVLMASFSDPGKIMSHAGALLKPTGFSLEGYKVVLSNRIVYTGYKNTLIYVVAGTALNMLMTCTGAYVISQKKFKLRGIITLFIIITMYFQGGLIPAYLNIRQLGLYNTRLALIIPEAIGTWNLFVMRTAFKQVPDSLPESAMIDGASDLTILYRIILPVSKATIAVITLFYAVGHWNSWFNAMIYLKDRGKYPLQLFLREILILNTMMDQTGGGSSVDGVFHLEELLKYCTIVIATVPVLCAYPFAQKYFVKGVMLGSLKG